MDNKKVLGVIRPTVEAVVENVASLEIVAKQSPPTPRLRRGKVGIIATYATVESKAFVKEIKKLAPKIKVYQKACPLLVLIIEEGEIRWKGLDLILEKYLSVLKGKNIDSLILGCTHYGLIAWKIKKVMGKKVKIISQGKLVAEKLKDYLERHSEIEKKLSKNKRRESFETDLSERYEKMAKMFLGKHFNKSDNFELIIL